MPVKRGEHHLGECSIKFPFDILWLPKSVLRPPGPEYPYSDCVLVVGISRPKLAALFLSLMLISLFLTFHVLYDRAVYSIQLPATSPLQPGSGVAFPLDARRHSNSVPEQLVAIVPPVMHQHHHQRPTQNVSRPVIAINHPLVVASASSNKMHFHKTGRRLPQVLIVGVRKCGTRALLEMLFLHPKIQKAAGEVHFFDRDENYAKGLDWYRKKMPYSFRGQITVEKSPSYFVTPEVPERVRAMNASIKLLVIVREPVTRAISDYTQLRSHAATAAVPSSSVVTASITRTFEELALFPNGSVNEFYRPLAISMYHVHLHRWLDVFAREQILIVNGDQLIEDPLSQLQRIETFLGIPHRITSNNFYFNETKGFYCLRNDTVDKCLRETKGRKHPHVDPTVIMKLRKFFADHNQKFYELIGEDLGWPEE